MVEEVRKRPEQGLVQQEKALKEGSEESGSF
jgi:hypothetical protein